MSALCPNCGACAAGLVRHNCVVAGDPDAMLGVLHCGCYYEAEPDAVESHVSNDCACDERAHPNHGDPGESR